MSKPERTIISVLAFFFTVILFEELTGYVEAISDTVTLKPLFMLVPMFLIVLSGLATIFIFLGDNQNV